MDENMRKSIQFTTKDATLKETEDGKTKIKVPISSVNEDREGDRIAGDGMSAITSQIVEENTPMFPNHGVGDNPAMYDFRDIMGKWINAEEGEIVNAEAVLREQNEYADELKDLISQDMPVGFSIGFAPNPDSVEETDDGKIYHDLDLLEISAVGIPANPDARISFAQGVAKKLEDNDIDLEQSEDKIVEAIKSLGEDEKDTNEQGEDGDNNESSEGKEDEDEEDEEDEDESETEEAKPFGPWEDHEDCVGDMMDEGYDEETAHEICQTLEDELTSEEGDNEDDEDEENGEDEDEEDMKELVQDLREESDELKEQIESLEEEKDKLARELKKTKAKNRNSERKGINPAEKGNDEGDEQQEQPRSFSDLTEEAIEFDKDKGR